MNCNPIKIFIVFFLFMNFAGNCHAQISITGSLPYNYNQDFLNYNGSSGGLPSGWTVSFTGTATYNGQGTGTSLTGGVWSYGLSGNSERAAGALRSGTPGNITHTVKFTNNTGSTITDLTISYDFEQWRYANTSGFTVTGTDAISSQSLSGLNQNGTASGTNGSCTVTNKQISLSSLSISNGQTFGISWLTTDDASNDNGIAIDNFSLTASSIHPMQPLPHLRFPHWIYFVIALFVWLI